MATTRRKSRKSARAAQSGTQERMLEMLHQVWLAGLGAVSKAQRGAPQLLDELIEEGARVDVRARGSAQKALRGVMEGVQEAVNSRIGQARGQATDALDSLEKIFRTRVHRALTQLGVPSAEELNALSRRVDALNSNIDRLSRVRRPARRAHSTSRSTAAHAAHS